MAIPVAPHWGFARLLQVPLMLLNFVLGSQSRTGRLALQASSTNWKCWTCAPSPGAVRKLGKI